MNIKEERKFVQELLEQGKLDSLSVQVIALMRFATKKGWKAVNNDPRKGFKKELPIRYQNKTRTVYKSFSDMMLFYNEYVVVSVFKMVERIALHYNKKTGKLFTQKHWLKFVKES